MRTSFFGNRNDTVTSRVLTVGKCTKLRRLYAYIVMPSDVFYTPRFSFFTEALDKKCLGFRSLHRHCGLVGTLLLGKGNVRCQHQRCVCPWLDVSVGLSRGVVAVVTHND